MPLTGSIAMLAAAMSHVLDSRIAFRLPIVIAGAMLAGGRRTAASWFRCAGVKDDWDRFYELLQSIGRNAVSLMLPLLMSIFKKFDPGDQGYWTLAIDDSPTKRFGPCVEAANIHHNPTPGPGDGDWLYGHNWVCLAMDLMTGQATQIGNVEPDSHPFQTGLAVDANDRLILKGNVDNNVVAVFEVSKTSGELNRVIDLSPSSNSISVLAFDENNQSYSVEYKSGATWLQTLDLTTGAVTNVGTLGAIPISALTFTSNALPTSITAVPEPASATWRLTASGIVFVNRRRLAKISRE